MPLLIDECLHRKMILCGPWTLYAVLRIIWQSWQSYHYTCAIADIVKAINGFMQEYARFKERFEELGERLGKATEKYQDVAGASFRRLEAKIQQIEEYRKGQRIPEELPAEEPIVVGHAPKAEEVGG
jgi:DNA recombination protein RmuC